MNRLRWQLRPQRRDREGEARKDSKGDDEAGLDANEAGPVQGLQRTTRDDGEQSGRSQTNHPSSRSHPVSSESPNHDGEPALVETVKDTVGGGRDDYFIPLLDVYKDQVTAAPNAHARPRLFD